MTKCTLKKIGKICFGAAVIGGAALVATYVHDFKEWEKDPDDKELTISTGFRKGLKLTKTDDGKLIVEKVVFEPECHCCDCEDDECECGEGKNIEIVIEDVKDRCKTAAGVIADKAENIISAVKERVIGEEITLEDACECSCEKAESIAEEVTEAAENIAEDIKEKAEAAVNVVEEAAEEIKEAAE